MDMNKNRITSKARGEPGRRGEGEGQRAEGKELRAKSKEHRAKSRVPIAIGRAGSREPKYRLTGRDGPPGSELIRGAPAWLARGTPLQCMNVTLHKCIIEGKGKGQPPSARGKPHTKPVISTTEKERSVAAELKKNRFLTAFGMTKGCRGTPAARGKLVRGMNAFPGSTGFIRGVYANGCKSPNARGMPGSWNPDSYREEDGSQMPVARSQPPVARGKPLSDINEGQCIGKVIGQMPVVRGKPPATRGKPHIMPVIPTRDEEGSATAEPENNKFLPAPGMTKGCRDKPPQVGSMFLSGKNGLNRERFSLSEKEKRKYDAL
jgi:hypothetical protein